MTSKQKTAVVLRRAAERIASGEDRHSCLAVSYAARGWYSMQEPEVWQYIRVYRQRCTPEMFGDLVWRGFLPSQVEAVMHLRVMLLLMAAEFIEHN